MGRTWTWRQEGEWGTGRATWEKEKAEPECGGERSTHVPPGHSLHGGNSQDSFWRLLHSVDDMTTKEAPRQGVLHNHSGKVEGRKALRFNSRCEIQLSVG